MLGGPEAGLDPDLEGKGREETRGGYSVLNCELSNWKFHCKSWHFVSVGCLD